MNLYKLMLDGGTVQIISDVHCRKISDIKKELVDDGWPERIVLRFYKRI